MKTPQVLSVVLGIAGVALFTWLLLAGHLSGPLYFGALALLVLTCLAIASLQRLRELDLKNLRITLSELKQVKAEIEEMYGGIENLRKATLVLDKDKMQKLGIKTGTFTNTDATVRYIAGCIKRERERLARVFVAPKAPEKLAEAILDASFDEKVFKWCGPEGSLDVPPTSVEEREKKKQDAAKQSAGNLARGT